MVTSVLVCNPCRNRSIQIKMKMQYANLTVPLSLRHLRRALRPRVLASPLWDPPHHLHRCLPGLLHRRHHLREPPGAGVIRGGQADQAAHQLLHGFAGGDGRAHWHGVNAILHCVSGT